MSKGFLFGLIWSQALIVFGDWMYSRIRYRRMRRRPYPRPGESWFWWMWQIRFSRYPWSFMCPWFLVMLSSREPETCYLSTRWYGLRLCWGHTKGWRYTGNGDLIFRCTDFTLSFQRRMMQEVYRGSR